MAILPVQGGVEVNVLVDGEPLREFDDDEAVDKPNKTFKYLEAPSGSTFNIRVTVKKTGGFLVCARVILDGKRIYPRWRCDEDADAFTESQTLLMHGVWVIKTNETCTQTMASSELAIGMFSFHDVGLEKHYLSLSSGRFRPPNGENFTANEVTRNNRDPTDFSVFS